MRFIPREYQRHIIRHELSRTRNSVWAGMGMGKTVSTLNAIANLQLAGEGKALVLAPLRVATSTWPDEALKWDHLAGLDITPLCGPPEKRRAGLKSDSAVYTLNYEQIPWLMDYLRDEWPFDIVVADEATRLKGFRLNRGGLRAAALAKMAHRARHWINLTGTPAPNGLIDLWGQQWFVDRGRRLGRTFTAFKQRWFEVENAFVEHKKWVPMGHAPREIYAALEDSALAVRSEDWFDLERPIVVPKYFDLPTKARRHYDEMEQEMFTELQNSDVEALTPASRTGKCSQIANGALYTDGRTKAWETVHDSKLALLEEIIAEAAGMPVLVAYEFIHDKERILKAFPKARELKDEKTIRAWNAGKIPVLVSHPQSAGHGLNLQDGGNIIVYFGIGWSREGYSQILERIGPVRQKQAGYDRNVFVYHILARDTVDQIQLDVCYKKLTTEQALMKAMAARKT